MNLCLGLASAKVWLGQNAKEDVYKLFNSVMFSWGKPFYLILSPRDIRNSEEEDQITLLCTKQQLKKTKLSVPMRFLTKTLICLKHQTEEFVSYSGLL